MREAKILLLEEILVTMELLDIAALKFLEDRTNVQNAS
jgi:hypothetical protein